MKIMDRGLLPSSFFYGISGKNCRRLFIGCGNARENVITGRKGEEKDESI
jgi:hypothetical protein